MMNALPALLDAHFDGMTRTPSASEVLPASDKIEIIEVVNRFHFYLDARRYEELGELFAPDGVLDWHWGNARGRAEIVSLFEKNSEFNRGVRHQALNHVVTKTGDDAATLFCYLMVVRTAVVDLIKPENRGLDTPYLTAHGVGIWNVAQSDGRWLIARSTLEQIGMLDAPDGEMRDQSAKRAQDRKQTGKQTEDKSTHEHIPN